jgi:hypothetical protein
MMTVKYPHQTFIAIASELSVLAITSTFIFYVKGLSGSKETPLLWKKGRTGPE